MTLRFLLLLLLAASLVTASNPVPGVYAGGTGGYSLDGISLLVNTDDPQIDRAQRYALAVLGADYNGSTHAAAVNYYSNPWLRDSFAWGFVPALKDASIDSYSSTEVRYWLDRQQPFGGWLTAPKSGYFDETPILISAVLNSYQVTGDLRLVRQALPHLVRGWHWLERGFVKPQFGSRFLIYANVPPHVSADWVDQVARHGYATQLEALWYWATRSLGILEQLAGHDDEASYYTSFASQIRSDINRLLWTTSAPYVYNAPPIAPFGHYRSWSGGHDYFELDSNCLAVLYGIATTAQARSIAAFVREHDRLLLGLGTPDGVPAKVVYGDYAPADYADKHERLAPGKYQNGYWPTVGALAAMAFAVIGDDQEARAILVQLSRAFDRQGDIREWYHAGGQGDGAPAFQWAARMFVAALYSAYLGVNEYAARDRRSVAAGISLSRPAGSGSADLVFHGRVVHLTVSAAGPAARLSVNGLPTSLRRIAGTSLCAGCRISAGWS